MNDPEKAKYLEENLAALPACAKSAVSGCLGTLTNLSYNVDANGNISVAISGTSDSDGKIAKENAERKAQKEKEAKKQAENKADEKKTAERLIKKQSEKAKMSVFNLSAAGTDIKIITQKIIAAISDMPAPTESSFNIKA